MSIFKRSTSKYWQCDFILHGVRVRKSTGCTAREEAEEWEEQERRLIREEYRRKRGGMRKITMGELAALWLEASKENNRDHHNNVGRVRKLFGAGLIQNDDAWQEVQGIRAGLSRDLGLHELTQEHLAKLKKSRLAEGNAPGTINREVALVQAMVGYAQTLHVVMPPRAIIWAHKRNKAASLKMSEGRGKLRWLTQEEEHRLLQGLQDSIDMRPGAQALQDNYDLVLFLLDTGARYGEATGLTWDAVDLEAGTINLYRYKVQNESTLRVPARTLSVLRRRWADINRLGIRYVFPQCTSWAWSGEDKPRGHATQGIQNHIDACALNDDPKRNRVTPHTFRDTFASRLAQAGVSLLKISHLLGHSTTLMTQKYAHLCPDATTLEAAGILDRLHGHVSAPDARPQLAAVGVALREGAPDVAVAEAPPRRLWVPQLVA